VFLSLIKIKIQSVRTTINIQKGQKEGHSCRNSTFTFEHTINN
jgi:hypothetical protein